MFKSCRPDCFRRLVYRRCTSLLFLDLTCVAKLARKSSESSCSELSQRRGTTPCLPAPGGAVRRRYRDKPSSAPLFRDDGISSLNLVVDFAQAATI